jgi:hypothetical protein
MKKRRFYPLQVLRALEGQEVAVLSNGAHCALVWFLRRARKMGQTMAILRAPTDLSQLERATETERIAILQNSNSRIFLKSPAALFAPPVNPGASHA